MSWMLVWLLMCHTNTQDNAYGAVIIKKSLREFTILPVYLMNVRKSGKRLSTK